MEQLKVNDRRRFDSQGNPRLEAPEAAPQAREEPPRKEPAAAGEDSERLRAELEAARRKVDELARAYQALDRDREDFKQRLLRERERMLEVERGNVAQLLIEAVDELDLSLMASGEEHSSLARGVRMIRDNILRKLEGSGVERLALVGQPFDPHLAEAADMELTPHPEQDHQVLQELRAGYRLGERVIRPARVRVARYVQPASA